MIQEVDSLMKENIQKEHEKTRMQMMALNAKINSHFLYNTQYTEHGEVAGNLEKTDGNCGNHCGFNEDTGIQL